MESLNNCINEYRKQLEAGTIQKAYKGLMEYILSLKTYFANKYPDDYVVGHFYQGYMDITFFFFTPIFLKNKKLKIVIVYNHEKAQFNACLVGQNKQIQEKYWKIFKDNNWDKYNIPSTSKEVIIENLLVESANFDNLPTLTKQIEIKTMEFIFYVTSLNIK